MNAVVLAAHGLHCHWLGPYGTEWVSTPALDAFACEAVVFDRHYADNPSPAGFRASCPPPVFQALQGAGVTVALVDDRKGERPDDGTWDHVIRPEPAGDAPPADAFIAAVESGLVRLAAAGRWLLWVETDRLIPPWDLEFETYQQYARAAGKFGGDDESDDESDEQPPIDDPAPGPIALDDDGLWHRLHNSFAAALTSFDAEMSVLAELFRKRGLDRTAAWVFTSGYGWPLGEHGVVGPGGSRLHEERVHVPLLLRLPGKREAMRRVRAFTQTTDLGPTLLDLFEVAVPPGESARSLLPLTTGSNAGWRDVVRSASGDERRVQTDEWAYLAPAGPRPERLYRKPDDMWEVNDLAPRHPDECEQLRALAEGKPMEEVTR
jgi:arylsulfatase A-like enzyme